MRLLVYLCSVGGLMSICKSYNISRKGAKKEIEIMRMCHSLSYVGVLIVGGGLAAIGSTPGADLLPR